MLYTYIAMAQTQQPNNADFIGNIAEILAERKEYLKRENARIESEQNEGFVLLANLKKHIQVLGNLPAFSEFAREYNELYNEATERETALLQQLETLAERKQAILNEYNVLNSLQPKKGENLKWTITPRAG